MVCQRNIAGRNCIFLNWMQSYCMTVWILLKSFRFKNLIRKYDISLRCWLITNKSCRLANSEFKYLTTSGFYLFTKLNSQYHMFPKKATSICLNVGKKHLIPKIENTISTDNFKSDCIWPILIAMIQLKVSLTVNTLVNT